MNLTTNIVVTGAGPNGFLGKHVNQAAFTYGLGDFSFYPTATPNFRYYFLGREYDLTDFDQAYAAFSETKVDSIIHMAAACGGILANKNSPADFLVKNTQMGLNVYKAALLYAKRHKKKIGVYTLGSVCFTKDCLVKNKDYQYLPINKIDKSDSLFGLNEITPVKKLISRIYYGEFIQVRSAGGEILTVTPEHPFLVERDGDITWVEAEELSLKDRLVLQNNRTKVVAKSIKLPPIKHNHNIENLPNKTKNLRTKINLTKKLSNFLGWYLAEGYASENTGAITLYFGEDEKDVIKKISRLTKNCFGREARVKPCPGQEGYRLDFNTKQLQAHLHDNFYLKNAPRYTSHFKCIPKYIFQMKKSHKIAFLKGYVSGDGHISKREYSDGKWIAGVQVTSVSRCLIYQIRDLFLSLGVYGAIHKRKSYESKINDRTIKGADSWTLKFTGQMCSKVIKMLFPDLKKELPPKPRRAGHNISCKKTKLGENWYVPILSISKKKLKNEIVFNFSTGNETYNANGLIVHNCSYPEHCPLPFKEDDIFAGYPEPTNAPYGQAKRTLLMLGQTYQQQYGDFIDGAHFIPANLFGEEDHFDLTNSHVIPAMIRKFVSARDKGLEEVRLWGTGEASREFLHAEDLSRVLIQAVTSEFSSDLPINIGTGSETSIKDLAALIQQLVGYSGKVVFTGEVSDGQPRRRLDTSRAQELLDFQAKISLKDGLQRTIKWYEENKDKIP